MKNLSISTIIAAMLLMSVTANSACPNQSTTITIPLSTATPPVADMLMYDQMCNVLLGTDFTATDSHFGNPLNATTQPAVVMDAAGVHFSQNGAPRGLSVDVVLRHISGKVVTITATVGPPIVNVFGGTTSP